MKKTTLCALAAAITAMIGTTVYASEDAVHIGSLKGPTSMGIVSMMEKSEAGETNFDYEFTMATAADELLAGIISEDLDIAMVPANVASVLYAKTQGGIHVIDVNTLGVLSLMECGGTIQSVSDLAGKTVYLTGKGTSPDYVLQYLMTENGLSAEDVTLEYKSEPTEVVSILSQDDTAIGLLPQPFATSAAMQNENLQTAMDLTQEWEKVQGENGSSLVTGVTIVRNGFLTEHEDAVQDFLSEHEISAAYTNENPADAAELIAAKEIVAKAPIAERAIPSCNITCIEGEKMKTALEGYLKVLYDFDPASVGGSLPDDDFYYIP